MSNFAKYILRILQAHDVIINKEKHYYKYLNCSAKYNDESLRSEFIISKNMYTVMLVHFSKTLIEIILMKIRSWIVNIVS